MLANSGNNKKNPGIPALDQPEDSVIFSAKAGKIKKPPVFELVAYRIKIGLNLHHKKCPTANNDEGFD